MMIISPTSVGGHYQMTGESVCPSVTCLDLTRERKGLAGKPKIDGRTGNP